MLPSPERIREVFDYDPATGDLVWREARRGCRVGEKAGHADKKGYLHVTVDGATLKGGRVAWCHYYGRWPSFEIDHLNRCPWDNRIENLRDAPHRENMYNRGGWQKKKSGLPKGVFLETGNAASGYRRRYRAVIGAYGTTVRLGTYDTPEEARAAYQAALGIASELAGHEVPTQVSKQPPYEPRPPRREVSATYVRDLTIDDIRLIPDKRIRMAALGTLGRWRRWVE